MNAWDNLGNFAQALYDASGGLFLYIPAGLLIVAIVCGHIELWQRRRGARRG